jgi:thioredoxin-like negative regulator of GroEL
MATELGRLRDRFPDVHFADIDIDVDTALARQLGVLNVPTVLYLAGGRIEAMCIGLSQPLAENLERLLRGEPIAP